MDRNPNVSQYSTGWPCLQDYSSGKVVSVIFLGKSADARTKLIPKCARLAVEIGPKLTKLERLLAFECMI